MKYLIIFFNGKYNLYNVEMFTQENHHTRTDKIQFKCFFHPENSESKYFRDRKIIT